jgi:hypothetical protein
MTLPQKAPANFNGFDEARERGRAEMLRAVCVEIRRLSLSSKAPELEQLYVKITAQGFLPSL